MHPVTRRLLGGGVLLALGLLCGYMIWGAFP